MASKDVSGSSDRSKTATLTLVIIYVNVALYATCYQIQRPLEPFLVEKLVGKDSGIDSSMEYAKLQSWFSIMQMFGSYLCGQMLDRFGSKFGFLVSFLASAACYFLLSQSHTLQILYLSKIPTIFQAGFLCAQVAAAQATADGTERVQALGRLTMSYTVGSVLGPTIGGILGASGDYYLGAKIAVAGSLISCVLTMFLPASSISTESKSDTITKENTASAPAPSTWKIISLVWLFLATKIITSVANSMTQSTLPVILKNNFGMDERGLGFTMSATSFCNAIVNGLFLGPVVNLAGGDLQSVIGTCILVSCILSVGQALVAQSGASLTTSLYGYLAITFLLSISQYVLATSSTSESTSRVGPQAKGTLIGIEHALFAAARIGIPQVGIQILQGGGVAAVSYACAAIFAVVYELWVCFKDGLKLPEETPATTTEERKEK